MWSVLSSWCVFSLSVVHGQAMSSRSASDPSEIINQVGVFLVRAFFRPTADRRYTASSRLLQPGSTGPGGCHRRQTMLLWSENLRCYTIWGSRISQRLLSLRSCLIRRVRHHWLGFRCRRAKSKCHGLSDVLTRNDWKRKMTGRPRRPRHKPTNQQLEHGQSRKQRSNRRRSFKAHTKPLIFMVWRGV
jgi:hypothetical protein